MSAGWKQAKLADIVSPVSRPISVIAGAKYRTIGVKWWGEGAYERQTIDGSQTAAETLFLVRKDDLIINKIWVRHGSIAIASDAVDGCAASNEFPTFELDQALVLPRWLHWLSKTRPFWAKCDSLSRGTSGKNRIKPELFLSIEIPLPLVAEQRRIVARIEELAAKIEEARGLRRAAANEVRFLLYSSSQALLDSLNDAEWRPLGELVTIQSGGTPSKSNPFFWNGSIPWISPKDMKSRSIDDSADHISESAISGSAAKLLNPGCVLIVVRGMILAHTVPVALLAVPATINQDIKALLPTEKVLPEFLCSTLWALNKRLLGLVEKSSHDTRRLETTKLIEFTIPVAPIEEQRRIVAYLDGLQAKVDALKKLQAETAAELDALLPSILDKAFKGEL